MASLTDKLKSLGVKVGAQDLKPPRPRNPFGIEQVLSGTFLETPLGQTFLVEARYPAGYRQGRVGLDGMPSRQVIARWAGEQRVCDCLPQAFAFLDTETTGLAGGTGTYAFLVGVGRFDGDEFHLAQFFMRDPIEEPAQLAAIEQFIAPCEALVTFNGKSFDVPLLNTRYTTHGWKTPLPAYAHVDLLPLARRLWRDRLPSRTLGNLEVQILGAARSEEDVPGWLIPSLYFEYLRDGDARPLKNVFYHNAMDVISMVALFKHMSGLLDDPLGWGVDHAVDLVGLARLYEDLGDIDAATRLYIQALDHDLPRANLLEAILRLAMVHKRRDDFHAAVSLWEQAARYQHLEAHIELAKFYEHRLRDYSEAARWTASAIDLVCSPAFPIYERRQWLPDLKHRLDRLQRKGSGKPVERDEPR